MTVCKGNIQRVIREGGTTLFWLHPSTSKGLLLCNLYLRFYALAGNWSNYHQRCLEWGFSWEWCASFRMPLLDREWSSWNQISNGWTHPTPYCFKHGCWFSFLKSAQRLEHIFIHCPYAKHLWANLNSAADHSGVHTFCLNSHETKWYEESFME